MRKGVEVPLPPPDSTIPKPPLPLRQALGWPGPDCGPGWTHQPGLWPKCRAAARWLRPLKSRPHCATGEDEMESRQADQLIRKKTVTAQRDQSCTSAF